MHLGLTHPSSLRRLLKLLLSVFVWKGFQIDFKAPEETRSAPRTTTRKRRRTTLVSVLRGTTRARGVDGRSFSPDTRGTEALSLVSSGGIREVK